MCIAVHAAVILRSSAPICTFQVCSLSASLGSPAGWSSTRRQGSRRGQRLRSTNTRTALPRPAHRASAYSSPFSYPFGMELLFCSRMRMAFRHWKCVQRPSPAVAVSPVFVLQFDLRVPVLPKSPRLEEIGALAIVQRWRGTRHHGGGPQGAGGPRGGGTLQPSKGDCPSVKSTSHLQGRRDARHCGDGPQGSGGPHSGGISQL